MSHAIRSALSAGVAMVSVGVIAVSPLAPAPVAHTNTVQIPGIELTAVPAIGAIPYQILVNLLGDGLALAPILIGGIEQCQVCIGPVTPPSPTVSPFTGWGALGFAVGVLTTPFAILGSLRSGLSITQALGVGILAFQIPADHTFALLQAPRAPFGGYDFAATRGRARKAVTDAIVGTIGVVEQVFTGVRTVISSGLVAITVFAQTLAAGADVITALQAGLAPVRASVATALDNTVGAIQGVREAVYADLTNGPGAATRPIPTVSAAAAVASSSSVASVAAATSAARVAAPRGGANRQPAAAAKKAGAAAAHGARAARTRAATG